MPFFPCYYFHNFCIFFSSLNSFLLIAYCTVHYKRTLGVFRKQSDIFPTLNFLLSRRYSLIVLSLISSFFFAFISALVPSFIDFLLCFVGLSSLLIFYFPSFVVFVFYPSFLLPIHVYFPVFTLDRKRQAALHFYSSQ